MNQEDIMQHPLFNGIPEEEVTRFLGESEVRSFEVDEVILTQGSASNDEAYIILQGAVDVFVNEQKMATLYAGEIFGEIALITSEPRTATVVVVSTLEIGVMKKESFVSFLKRSISSADIRKQILTRIQNNFYKKPI